MKTLILYHAHCMDGFGAALVAWMEFGPAAEYLPVSYGDPIPPRAMEAEQVFILDFSFSRDQLERLRAQLKFNQKEIPPTPDWEPLHVIDHHQTAELELQGLPWAHFDMSKSGAVLAWEYFRDHGCGHTFGDMPSLFAYIEDRDLWKWDLPFSREVSAALGSRPRTFGEWDLIVRRGSLALDELAAEGVVLLRQQRSLVDSICKRWRFTDVKGPDGATHRVPTINTPVLISESCERLLEQHWSAPFVASYFDQATRNQARLHVAPITRIWSLRSRQGFDCGAVAKANGGGGHPCAAGFEEYHAEPDETEAAV